MSTYPGFDKSSGPTAPPDSKPIFGTFLRASSSPFSDASSLQSTRRPDATRKMTFPSSAFERSPISYPYQSSEVNRPIVSRPRLADHQLPFYGIFEAQTTQRPSLVTSFVASRNLDNGDKTEVPRFQWKRSRSPTSPFINEEISRNAGSNLPFSPVNNVSKLPGNADFRAIEDKSLFTTPVASYPAGIRFPPEPEDVQGPKRARSPELLSTTIFHEYTEPSQSKSKRSSLSPPKSDSTSAGLSASSGSQFHQKPLAYANNTSSETGPAKGPSFPAPKRTRSPPILSTDQVFQGSYSTQDAEREIQAKAKRLARFKVELSEAPESISDGKHERVTMNKDEQPRGEGQKFISKSSKEPAGDFGIGGSSSDYEGLESSNVVVGLCPDMCPDSERAERERKGDLDQYERLDGDRNQTSRFLAVKKYNRTAEREGNLIRPMPILQNTVDYLLNLLNQSYDEKFLGLYNFLWDRMRAIRMDLRMQHIFNEAAITMLEQMIRLHIIAMHELCEYSKGEGFSEGFDAHLNIEQMNKTSVELFQMYDDHRKKGVYIPTEREFRGYYALLKLDKHPGYKVEPAELSLDLAKMTPEVRQTPEVLFARDVARACRTENFIAFFRLAHKATYLQACLMHAHFAKLRTQALASLHSGLQNNQGLPVAHVAKWLGMEGEDIESLLSYHGFLIKEFEEPYMVKEGPFLNSDKDFPTKCSKLVQSKKSRAIVEDVSPSNHIVHFHAAVAKKIQLSRTNREAGDILSSGNEKSYSTVSFAEGAGSVRANNEVPRLQAFSLPADYGKKWPMIETPAGSNDDNLAAAFPIATWELRSAGSLIANLGTAGRSNDDRLRSSPLRKTDLEMKDVPLPIVPKPALQDMYPCEDSDHDAENSVPERSIIVNMEDENAKIHQENNRQEDDTAYHDEEAAKGKLRLMFRLWRRHSVRKRLLREQRLSSASAALKLLALGPPIQLNKDEPSSSSEFDIDHIMRERHRRRELSWSRLNASNVVADILRRRNPDAKCLCWKIVVCSQMENSGDNRCQRNQVAQSTADSWLQSKLMPLGSDDEDLAFSAPGLSIWKQLVCNQSGADLACCLTVIKDANSHNPNETVSGASAILFLVSESIPWKLQKDKLHKLLLSIPSGSSLPLLILSGLYLEEASDPSSLLVKELGLHEIDKSRISTFVHIPLTETRRLDGFFSDMQLREGLQWLAKESPLQPVLHHVKTLELVLSHLNSSLGLLDSMNNDDVCPNTCISAFNDALDRSLADISSATEANMTNWPCPEIALLDDASDERRIVTSWLPSIGWSSEENVEPLMHNLRILKLPNFPDVSWLTAGSNLGNKIENQRVELEACLIKYLVESSKIMGFALAAKEGSVMLQRCARLELCNLRNFIVPNWVAIFRRIFGWRLANLAAGPFSMAFIKKCTHVASSTSGEAESRRLLNKILSPLHMNQPSLDETIEVANSSILLAEFQKLPEAGQALEVMVPNGIVRHNMSNFDDRDDRNFHQGAGGIIDDTETNREMVVGGVVNSEAEKLSKLLKQCNLLQSKIDQKLSIYF